MYKYIATCYLGSPYPTIGKVKIERQTEKSVWIRGDRYNKKSEYHNYFDTWKEAHDYILALANKNVELTGLRLNKHKKLLDNIENLQED